jgi:hypothetical protein
MGKSREIFVATLVIMVVRLLRFIMIILFIFMKFKKFSTKKIWNKNVKNKESGGKTEQKCGALNTTD